MRTERREGKGRGTGTRHLNTLNVSSFYNYIKMETKSLEGKHFKHSCHIYHKHLLHLILTHTQCYLGSWRDDLAVKSTGCSSREPRFDSQHPNPVTMVYDSSSRGSDIHLQTL